MSVELNVAAGQRVERKLLIHVAEWGFNNYTLLTAEPSDWSTNYTDYYTKSGTTYTKVTGAEAPTFATNTYYKLEAAQREILGTRVEDSSIELNADIQTSTDIRGKTYTDVNKTEPQQTLEGPVMGGSKLSAYLYDAAMHNRISDYNGMFNVYVIAAFIGDSTNGYETVMHKNCSIIPTSIGGDTFVNMPLELHYSNDIVSGTVDKLSDDFTFTEDVTV